MKLSFYGGAGKVTGSNFLIEGVRGKILVDCGIEQGADFVAEHIYGPFAYDPKTIDSLVVTHAHLDHVGRIPKLVRDGFNGKIYMTPPTKDLAELIMLDSVGILGEEARRRGIAPLYEEQDVEKTFAMIETLEYHTEKQIAPSLSVYLRNTGHILGSASVRIKDEEGIAVAITGDIGNSPSPLLPDWEPITDADALVMESVYGDRLHTPHTERVGLLRETLRRAIARGGTILIPAFSLERTQIMLYELSNFFSAKELPQIPVFLDSPLAIKVTAVYEKCGLAYFRSDAEEEIKRERSIFKFPFLKQTLSRGESEAIEKVSGPKIIIAGAGMSHGGRIGKWEALYLLDPSSTLIIVGYQAPGSPGRRMSDGATRVRLNGAEIKIKAKVENLYGWSAHADRDELLKFAEACLQKTDGHDVSIKTKTIFTAIGEPSAERFLAQRIHDYLGARAIVPDFGQSWEITKDSIKKI
ncbi:MBL fold metallo-hydrolase [Candidatus Kaiserbacteria bacterium]|nr:MBL fold metallo-hydrolase [Candidatus Kaiserbacteria bacterium]